MLSRIPWFTHYTNRKLEWLLAIYTLGFGLFLLMPEASMNSRGFDSSLALMPETGWGITYTIVGALHNLALHVNGRGAWTPFGRLAALTLNSQVFLTLTLGILDSNPWSSGVYTYAFFSLGFCGAAIYTAALDCGREIKVWRSRHG